MDISMLPADLQKLLISVAETVNQKAQDKQIEIASRPDYELIQNTITKSNFLARAKHGFSLVELRVMEMMISKLNPVGMVLNEYKTIDITLSALEYAKATGVTEKSAYRELKKSVSALVHTVITIKEASDRIERPLMFEAEYKDSEGKIIASFHPKFLPHLINMREQFTQYALADVLQFKSEYTWRIYEMLSSVKNQRDSTLKITVDELRERIGIPESYRWVNIDRMLEKSKLEIETKTDYLIFIERKKTSRKITHLEFKIEKRTQRRLL